VDIGRRFRTRPAGALWATCCMAAADYYMAFTAGGDG
jgi:hypothetical protein